MKETIGIMMVKWLLLLDLRGCLDIKQKDVNCLLLPFISVQI